MIDDSHQLTASLAAPKPPDVERDIARAENLLGYLNLNHLRMMMVLDIILARWVGRMREQLPRSSPADGTADTIMGEPAVLEAWAHYDNKLIPTKDDARALVIAILRAGSLAGDVKP